MRRALRSRRLGSTRCGAPISDTCTVRRGFSRRRGIVRGNVGQECHLPGALDRDGHEALVLAAGAAHTARADLASLGEVPAEKIEVLVVDVVHVVLAEKARLPLQDGSAWTCAGGRPCRLSEFPASRFRCHDLTLQGAGRLRPPMKNLERAFMERPEVFD